MSKSKQPSEMSEPAPAPKEQSKQHPAEAEDECCALLRGDPIVRPPPAQRRRRPNGNAEDKPA